MVIIESKNVVNGREKCGLADRGNHKIETCVVEILGVNSKIAVKHFNKPLNVSFQRPDSDITHCSRQT